MIGLIRKFLQIQFIRYVIVGMVSAAIEVTMLIVLIEHLSIHYLASNGIAFLTTNLINFTLSKTWVFESKGKRNKLEFGLFMLFVTCGLLISQSIFWICVDKLDIYYRFSKVISIAFVVLWNFLSRKHLVFNSAFSLSLKKNLK